MNISIEELKKAAEAISFEKHNSYLSSYPIILSWVQKQTIDEEFLVIASHVVYGWMPRILNLKNRNAIQFLEKVRNEDIWKNVVDVKKTNEMLEDLIFCVNRSLVGVSKLLHFLNPEVYPIWDSNVYCYLFKKLPNHNQMSKIETYRNYKDSLDILISNPEINEAIEKVNQKLIAYYELYPIDADVELTVKPMRAIELLLFTEGRLIASAAKIAKTKRARKSKALGSN